METESEFPLKGCLLAIHLSEMRVNLVVLGNLTNPIKMCKIQDHESFSI